LITKVLRDHIERFPPTSGEIDDETNPRNPVRRVVSLLLTHDKGEPIHRARWLHIWQADSHRQATTSF
jgi:hypothetical protein